MQAAFALHPFPRNCPLGGFSFFSLYKESCVHHWQRRGRNSAQLRPPARQPASQPVPIRQLSVVSSLLLQAASQNSLTPSSPSNHQGALLPPCQETTPWARIHTPLQPYQITEGTPQRPHFSCRDRKKLIDPLMHSQVKKNSKETHVAACVPVVQLWRGGSVLA